VILLDLEIADEVHLVLGQLLGALILDGTHSRVLAHFV